MASRSVKIELADIKSLLEFFQSILDHLRDCPKCGDCGWWDKYEKFLEGVKDDD